MKRIFFDIETTGTNTESDRIVQIGMMVFEKNNLETYDKLINPEIPIPSEAFKVHGISDEHVQNSPTFHKIASELYNYFNKADEIITHNGNQFDIPLLLKEFERVGIKLDLSNTRLIDTLQIERKLSPNTLDSLYFKYTRRRMINQHDAMDDVKATIEVFKGQLDVLKKEHPEALEDIVGFMLDGKPRADIANKFSYDDDGVLVWNFGKYRNQSVATDLGYVRWFLDADFPEESKSFLSKYVDSL